VSDPPDLGTHQVTGPALAPVCELGHPLAVLDGSHVSPQDETAHQREPGGLCLAYGGTMPDGRVRLCGGDRWHGDSHAYEFGLAESAPAPDLDHDPVALAWARGKVLAVTGRWRAMANRMAGTDMVENAEKWRLIAVAVEKTMVGGNTDDLGVFDERHAR
jgi:hypothetical protein